MCNTWFHCFWYALVVLSLCNNDAQGVGWQPGTAVLRALPGQFPETCELKSWDRRTTRVTILLASTKPFSSDLLSRAYPLANLYDGAVNYYALYAKLHNYTLKRVQTPSLEDAMPHHIKSPLTYKYLNTTDILVYMDFDVVIPLTTDLLCLLEHWGFMKDNDAVVLQAADPPINKVTTASDQNIVMANTGFMVWKNVPRAFKLLEAWRTATRIDQLTRREFIHGPVWKDQGVWNKYIRRETTEGKDLIVVPCDEANGFKSFYDSLNVPKPYGAPDLCEGRYVSHAWFEKFALGDWIMVTLAKTLALEVYDAGLVHHWHPHDGAHAAPVAAAGAAEAFAAYRAKTRTSA